VRGLGARDVVHGRRAPARDPQTAFPATRGHGRRACLSVSAWIRCGPANTILRTAAFDTWLTKRKNPIGKAHILERIRSAERGQFGDCKPVGEGVSEMRIHAGPGYRLYFTRAGNVVYVLLCGGTKGGQERDIDKAKTYAKQLRNEQ
jgi:putative addiction module killer protein